LEPHPPAWAARLFAAYDALALAAFRRTSTETKADGTAVTDVDRETSRTAVALLREEFPDHGILSEEEPEPWRPDAAWQWVLDPLDGTASFARGHPVWGLGLGLMHRWAPVAGYLRFPALDETYGCAEGKITVNGQPWRPGGRTYTGDTFNVVTASRLHADLPYERLREVKLRNYGSNLYHLLLVALERSEAAICPRCQLWDLAAALPFTQAAGCVAAYLDGTPFDPAALMAGPGAPHRLPAPLLVGPPEQVAELRRLLA